MGFTTPEDEQVIGVSEIVWIHGVGIGERVSCPRDASPCQSSVRMVLSITLA